ncbi:O-antigen ligase family protein [Deinococcus pimensis]|uniref:O-antigen ligase family protein n=1 Tax=Deinococcus pimensis TaxID=309888 RepID=UPI0004B2C731|nr:O-antigen ligase family protein [Deinococcus pimensis]
MSAPVPTEPSVRHPRRLAWLIALVPVLPLLYVAALARLGALRGLDRTVRLVLGGYVVTQVLAALFTPDPLLSVPLALARAILLLAMIAAGVWLGDGRWLRPLLWGHLVVFVTAWAFTLATVGPSLGPAGRLSHPLYYFVSLGLLASVSLLIIVSWKGASPWWRFPAGALAVATLLASGSRGALVALAVGSLAAVLAGNLRFLRALGLVVLTGVLAVGVVPNLRASLPVEGGAPDTNLTSTTLSGRDEVWQGAIRAFRASPVGGQGPYLAGRFLTFLVRDRCQLSPALEDAGVHCPAWVDRFRGVWSTAHNVVLHSLAETGVIGTAGLLALFALGAVATWRVRDGLLLAIFWGFMAMNVVDVVTTLPSPHFAELFWVTVGVALARSGWTRTPTV